MTRAVRSIAEILGRPRWSEDDARAILAAIEATGESVGGFAAEHGLSAQRLYVWRRRLRRKERAAFVEVDPTVRTSGVGRYEVAFASGEILRIHGPVNGDELRIVVSAVRGSGAC